MESVATCLNRSVSSFVECENIFKVKDTSLIASRGCYGLSLTSECSSGGTKRYNWCLSIKNESGYLAGYLYDRTNPSDQPQAWFCLSIIDSNGLKKYLIRDKVHHFTTNSYIADNKIIQIQELKDDPTLWHDDELWLHCEVATLKQFDTPSFSEIADSLKFRLPVNVDEEDAATYLPKLEKYSDLILAIGDKEIKAHKFMLAMRSSVFATMFESDMMEQKQNRVVIQDMEHEVVEQMLFYMYTGKTPKLSEMADRLLMAAEKYSLDALKVLCQQQLSSTISSDNILQLMSLAELYRADLLKDTLNDYITENIKWLINKPCWQKMLYAMSHKQQLNNGS